MNIYVIILKDGINSRMLAEIYQRAERTGADNERKRSTKDL